MPVSALSTVLKIFGGGAMSDDERSELYREALLMTLARQAYADTNLAQVEVDTAARIYHEHTGQELPVAEFRHAARSEIYETTPLPRYLSRIATHLSSADKRDIAKALAELIHSDENISPNEVDFFNGVVKALDLSFADVAGLVAKA